VTTENPDFNCYIVPSKKPIDQSLLKLGLRNVFDHMMKDFMLITPPRCEYQGRKEEPTTANKSTRYSWVGRKRKMDEFYIHSPRGNLL
jgi:hypothetical protein